MAITLSKFTNKDYRAYFEAWGIELSDQAKDQIDTNGFESVVPLEFYWVKDDKLAKDFPTKTLPLDGVDEQSVTLSGVCSSSVLSECDALNGVVSFSSPQDDSIYFLSLWSENGATTSIDSGEETNSTLQVNGVDSNGNSVVIYLRAAKTTTEDGIDGTKIAMNDTTEVDANTTSLVLWIDADDNNFQEGQIYSVTDPIYINVKEGNDTIRRIKVDVEDFIAPKTLTYDDASATLIEGFEEIEDSSTYFVATTDAQGPTVGVWENNTSYTPLFVKVKDDDGNPFTLQLRAKRDVYQTDGESGTYVIMNSGIIYGKNNAFVLSYDAEDNPSLSSQTHYEATELLIINAKLWHSDRKLREQMQIKVDITTP
jgi:type 1 fimbria pilin